MDIYNMWFSHFLLLHILASVLHGLLHTAGRVDGHDRPRQLRPQLHPLLLDVPPIQVVAAYSRSDKMIDHQGDWKEDLWAAIEASEPVASPAADSTNPRPTWNTWGTWGTWPTWSTNPPNQLTTTAAQQPGPEQSQKAIVAHHTNAQHFRYSHSLTTNMLGVS